MGEIDQDGSGPSIGIPESEFKNLTVLNRSDLAFAILYGLLFFVGFILTVISI